MKTLYNDNEPFVCEWLTNLIDAGELPKGDVLCRSIKEIDPHEIPDTFHTFAGIGGWPLALRMAGWPDDRAAWTGSCPCQPFSTCGSGAGFDDPRDLWPFFVRLVGQCRPRTVWGEQVVGRDDSWWERASRDLEREGYGVHAEDWRADVFGCPTMRRRLYWVADIDRDSESLSAIYAEARGAQAARSVAPETWGDPSRAFANGVADGIPGVVAQGNAAFGNAIVPQVAAEFVRVFMESFKRD